MISTYQIRMEAIFDNFGSDRDVFRLQREVSRLDLDLCSAIRRCERAEDDCVELHDLLDSLHQRSARVLDDVVERVA